MAPLASISPVRSVSPISSDSDQYSNLKEDRLRKRRFTKHVVERKRRDRINTSLDQLKDLILTAMQKDPESYAKMEKADILDLTVQFVKNKCSRAAHHQQRSAPVHRQRLHHPHHQPQYQQHPMETAMPPLIPAPLPVRAADVRAAGYHAARQEVTRFMDISSAPAHVTARLTESLSVDIPSSERDNLYRRYKHRAACSKGLVSLTSPVTNDLLKVAAPAVTSVWRPF